MPNALPNPGLDRLARLLNAAEQHLRMMKLTEATIDVGDSQVGMIKFGEWRIAVAPKDSDDWLPIQECNIATRIMVARALPELEKAIVRANAELMAKAEEAIADLEQYLAGKEIEDGA